MRPVCAELVKLGAQDWANLEACRIKAMLSYLARLSWKTSNSRPESQLNSPCSVPKPRSQKVFVLKTLFLHFRSKARHTHF